MQSDLSVAVRVAVLAALPVLAACADVPDTSITRPTVVVEAPAAASASVVAPEVIRATLAVEGVVHDPCTARPLTLSGRLQLRLLVRPQGDDAYRLRYAVQATNVIARAPGGETVYRLVGAGRGNAVTRRGERAVTSADFRAIALGDPGARVGRGSVGPRYTGVLVFPVGQDGRPLAPQLEDLRPPKLCGA